MQHAPITTPITDKLASMTWIRWFRQLVDRVDEIKGTADAPAWETITGKPTEFPPSEHRHEWTDLDDVPTEFPPEPHTHAQYLTEETDPTVPAYVKDITQADIDLWNTAGRGAQIAGVTGNPLGDLVFNSQEGLPGTVGSVDAFGTIYPTVVMPDNREWTTLDLFVGTELAEYGVALSAFNAVTGVQTHFWQPIAGSLAVLKSKIDADIPGGWRLPSETDTLEFIAAAGADTAARKIALRNNTGWTTPISGADNSTGFTALGNGRKGFYRAHEFPGTWYSFAVWPNDIDGKFLSFRMTDSYGTGLSRDTYSEYGNAVRLVRDAPIVRPASISVPAFSVRLFDDAAFLTLAQVFDIPAQEIPVPGYDQRYYLCAQRSGDTVALVSVPQADVYTINMSNIVPLWRFEIHGTELHQISYDNMGDGLPNKQEFAQLRTEPYRLAVEGGFAVTLGAGRSLTMTRAEVFFGHHRISVLGFASATDTVHDFFHVAGVWDDTEAVGGWAWPNTQYDDGTNLVTMGNNKWSALYVYRSIGDDKELFVVYAQSEANTLESARLIGIPPTPALVQWHSMLVGRILFQKSAATGIFEPYQPATFVRAEAPSLALNDLTDVDTAGAVTGDILVLQSDGIWRPQAP